MSTDQQTQPTLESRWSLEPTHLTPEEAAQQREKEEELLKAIGCTMEFLDGLAAMSKKEPKRFHRLIRLLLEQKSSKNNPNK